MIVMMRSVSLLTVEVRWLVATFAERLTHLFDTVHPPGRGPHSLQEVATAVNNEGVVTLSPSYLSQLKNGQKTNPAANTVAALARFFRVSTEYFLNDEYAERMDLDLDILVKIRESGLQQLVDRSIDLSPVSRETISSLVENLRRVEGLPEAEPSSADEQERASGDHES